MRTQLIALAIVLAFLCIGTIVEGGYVYEYYYGGSTTCTQLSGYRRNFTYYRTGCVKYTNPITKNQVYVNFKCNRTANTLSYTSHYITDPTCSGTVTYTGTDTLRSCVVDAAATSNSRTFVCGGAGQVAAAAVVLVMVVISMML